jgi:hypothetical protein
MSDTMVPQTLTVMEAGFTLRPGVGDEFWPINNASVQIAATQPGFLAVCGGPIAGSSWLYFSGTWETPELMDRWYWHAPHKPLQDLALSRWFDRMYIRKWRLPAENEGVTGRVFCQSSIHRAEQLDSGLVESLCASLNAALPRFSVAPFETLTNEFESQPFQLIGPVQELPQKAPVKYLLLTHWRSPDDVKRWLESPDAQDLKRLGEVSHEILVPVREEPGTRPGLRPDGIQRDWTFETGPHESLRRPAVSVTPG